MAGESIHSPSFWTWLIPTHGQRWRTAALILRATLCDPQCIRAGRDVDVSARDDRRSGRGRGWWEAADHSIPDTRGASFLHSSSCGVAGFRGGVRRAAWQGMGPEVQSARFGWRFCGPASATANLVGISWRVDWAVRSPTIGGLPGKSVRPDYPEHSRGIHSPMIFTSTRLSRCPSNSP